MTTPTLDSAIAAGHEALARFVTGDPGGYLDLYADDDDISLGNPFGPFAHGRKEVAKRLTDAAANYRDGKVAGIELVASYASNDLACVVEVEKLTAIVGGGTEHSAVSLRVTSTFRCKDNEWRLVHRHADPITSSRPAASIVQ